MKATIFLRGDGGSGVGWGHINRLLALRSILNSGFRTVLCVSPSSVPILRGAGLQESEYRVLFASNRVDFETEWGKLNYHGKVLVLDGYAFDSFYRENAIKSGFKLVLIDDFAHPGLRCDLLINHAPKSGKLYEARPEIGRCCCGTDYALLRPAFYQPIPYVQRNSRSVFFSMGGADPENYTLALLQELLPVFKNMVWRVAVTSSFQNNQLQELQRLSSQYPNLELHKDMDATGMRTLMLGCAFGLVASSSVMMEAWASGLYPAVLCYTENQQVLFRGAVETNMAYPFDSANPTKTFNRYLNGVHSILRRNEKWNPPVRILEAFNSILT